MPINKLDQEEVEEAFTMQQGTTADKHAILQDVPVGTHPLPAKRKRSSDAVSMANDGSGESGGTLSYLASESGGTLSPTSKKKKEKKKKDKKKKKEKHGGHG